MSRLEELGVEECVRLLETQVLGRLVVQGSYSPRIWPVNYAVVDDAVHILTAVDSELARSAPGRSAAFEVDASDAISRQGWSVVVEGRLEIVPAVEAEAYRQRLPRAHSWLGEEGRLLMRLPWITITGRRLGTPTGPPTQGSAGHARWSS